MRFNSTRVAAVSLTALGIAVAAFAGTGDAARTRPTADPPRNTADPTISGAFHEGQTLRASPGTWIGTQPITFTYQWIRCSSRMSDCRNIGGATGRSFALTRADVGRRLIVSVQARNSAGAQSDTASTPVIAPRATAPANSALPTIGGAPQEGQTLIAGAGTWSGTQPFTFAYQWLRCDPNGSGCAAVIGATAQTFALTIADVGRTLRVSVTARNVAGSRAATSATTAVIAAAPPPGPGGQIRLPNGKTSIPVTSVSLPQRLIVDQSTFSPNPVRSRRQAISVRFRVTDTRGFVVRDALVFVRSTPLVTSTPLEQVTQQDGTVAFALVPRASFPLRRGQNVQFFVRARKAGENVLAGISTRRLVQVRTASAR
jgi:hypothetical protein